jgi:uncharacterized protein YndB with AHSA1/START domain
MSGLEHRLDRTVTIGAARETVFRFFTDPSRWASWWGAGSNIDARPGGQVKIRHPNGIEFLGEVREIAPPERIVFTYGDASGTPIPPGGSLVTIRLEEVSAGTRLHLTHAFAEAPVRDNYVQGWRFQLSLFANVVSNEVHSSAAGLVDAWFGVWRMTDAAERERALNGVAAPGIQFRDRYSLLEGIEDLNAHIGASLRFMPGISLERRGEIRHCQGTVLADWAARGPDGKDVMSGTSVLVLGMDGKIETVTGVANL